MKIKQFLYLTLVCAVFSSCSINKMAINAVSNALGGSGSAEVFTADNDPQLVADALPFAMKMYEALLEQNPYHEGLLLTTGSLFIMYANAFVQGPAEMLDPIDDYAAQHAGKDRAKLLYLRGYSYLMRGLERKFPGIGAASDLDGSLAPLLARARKADVPFLYWTVAGGLAAFSIDVFDFDLGLNLLKWSAMMERAYQLDPDFNNGAIDDFYILYYASLAGILGLDKGLADVHFERAIAKSKGRSASPYVSYATAVCVAAQDYEGFTEMLEKALAINPDDDPANRLVNIITQRKARHLLDTAYEHFTSLPYHWEEADGSNN